WMPLPKLQCLVLQPARPLGWSRPAWARRSSRWDWSGRRHRRSPRPSASASDSKRASSWPSIIDHRRCTLKKMLIDCHVHMFSEDELREAGEAPIVAMQRFGRDSAPVRHLEQTIAEMSEAGIDKGVLLPIPTPQLDVRRN